MNSIDRDRRNCRGEKEVCLHLQLRSVAGDERGQTWGMTGGQRPLVRMQHMQHIAPSMPVVYASTCKG